MTTFKHLTTENLPSEWTIKFFQELATYRLGRTPQRNNKQYWDNGVYPWVSIADMPPYGTIFDTNEKISEEAHNNIFQKRLTPAGTILMSFKLTIGRVSKLGTPAYHNEAIISIFTKDREVLQDDYLFYYLSQIDYRQYQDTAVKGMTLNKGKIDSLEIPLPPLSEQRRIAHVLTTAQNAVAQQEHLITLTTELKRALMHKLFTEGLHSEKQKQTEIGLIPESWDVVPITKVITKPLQNGAFIKKPSWGKGILFANVVDMYREIYLDFSKLDRIEEEIRNVKQYLLDENDILVVRSSLKREGVGQNCIIKDLTEPVFYDCHLIRIKPDISQVIPEFLSYFWRSPQGKQDLIQRSKTTTMTTINQTGISGALIPLPSADEQKEIVKILLSADNKIQLHRLKQDKLTALFRTLLHQLMTAQIRVNNLE